MKKIFIWILAVRPRTLPAAVGPILLGQILVVMDDFSWLTAFFCLTCALSLQLAVNLANDLFDGVAGVDQNDRLGPTRALQAGLLSENELQVGLWVFLAIATASGLWLVIFGHWVLWILGGLALFGVLGYSGGRKPYANLGLGEVAVWLFFGPIAVLGSLLAHRSPLNIDAFIGALLVGLPVAAILVVNNLRDRHTDARVGKLTLAVRLGQRANRCLFTLLTLGPWLVSVLFVFVPWTWFVWVGIGLVAVNLNLRFWRSDGSLLNPILGQTALYSLGFALWLGLILGELV